MTTTVDVLSTFRGQLPYLPRALALVWKAAPGWSAAWLLLLLIQGALPVAVVYLTRTVVDRLTGTGTNGVTPESMGEVLAPAVLLAGVFLLAEVLRAASKLLRTAQADLVRDHVSKLVHRNTTSADLAQFESPEFHDRLHRARLDSHERPIALVQSLGSLVQSSITLVAMAIVLVRFGWWVPVVLIASTIPALAVVARYAMSHHRWTLRTTPETRRSWYYDWLLSTREPAAELRLFDIGPHFSERFQKIRSRLRRERLALTRREALAEVAAGGFALIVMGALAVWMMVRTVEGAYSFGELAMFVQAFSQGQKLMRSLLETVGQIWSNILFLDNLFGFLDVRPAIVCPQDAQPPPTVLPPSIRFRSVTFGYPGTGQAVFEDFDLEVPGGSTAALLGVNGVGKSTLFKLACRFYDPDRGSVEIGGTDLRRLNVATVRRLITALFQEPVRYSETAGDNISIADLGGHPDEARVAAAVRMAGAEALLAKLREGRNTMLGTWFSGGAELSVGEWQRLALARALVRSAPVLLLDEPTAAMDSWSESEWAGNLDQMAEGRTVILITHRLTTAMHADRIHIIDGGRIVESGSHGELLARHGPYRRAWEGQFGEFRIRNSEF